MAEHEAVFDSLPYIDPEPTPRARAAAEKLITSLSLSPSDSSALHPSLPALTPSTLSPSLEELLTQASLGNKIPSTPDDGISTARYLSISRPSDPSEYDSSLDQAYTLSTYLRLRGMNLSLLEKFGKNAWLTANAQLEDELKTVERELAAVEREIEGVNRERKNRQEGVAGEVQALEEGWKEGLGRAIEAEIAAEELRGKILEERRR